MKRLDHVAAVRDLLAPGARLQLEQSLGDLEHRVLETREALDRAEVDMTILQDADQTDPVVLLATQEQIRRLGAARSAWCRARSAAEQGRLDLRVLGCVQRLSRERDAG